MLVSLGPRKASRSDDGEAVESQAFPKQRRGGGKEREEEGDDDDDDEKQTKRGQAMRMGCKLISKRKDVDQASGGPLDMRPGARMMISALWKH